MLELDYLTGTGNTYRVAEWIAGAARARGLDARLVRIGPVAAPGDGPRGEIVGVLFPTHGFTAPWGVVRHVARLDRVRGRQAFVVACRAGWGWTWLRLPGFEGTGTWLVALMLALKGARVVGVTGVDMPSNWTAVHPGLRPSNAADIVERARARVHVFADAVLGGSRVYRGWLSLAFGLVLAPVSIGYMLFGRPLLAKLFIADERCTSCALCAKACPFSAISMLGRPKARPYWTWRCESCMRCMNVCPEGAVQAWQPGLVGLMSLATAVGVPVGIAMTLAGFVRIGMAGILVSESLSWALVLLTWAALYAGLWWLTRFAPIAWLVGHSTFTRIYRRYHEPETDLRAV